MSERRVVEWPRFRAVAGVTGERMLEASRRVQQAFSSGERGFMHREFLRDAAGDRADVVHWTDRVSAGVATRVGTESPGCHAYLQLMVTAEPPEASAVAHVEHAASCAAGDEP